MNEHRLPIKKKRKDNTNLLDRKVAMHLRHLGGQGKSKNSPSKHQASKSSSKNVVHGKKSVIIEASVMQSLLESSFADDG